MTPETMHAEWDRLAAQGLTDTEIRERIIRTYRHDPPTPGTHIPCPRNKFQAAGQAIRDVQQISCDLRDIDPGEVWSTIEQWPATRILTALVVACAAINPDHTERQLWGWTEDLTQGDAYAA